MHETERSMLRHVRALWGKWSSVPLLFFGSYALLVTLQAELRLEHVLLCAGSLGLAYASRASQRFFVHFAPFLASIVAYDLCRVMVPALVTPDRVAACELRQLDLAFSRVGPDLTLQEWLVHHHHPVFDVALAVPYLIQAYAAVIYGIYLYFHDRQRMRFYSTAFLIGNTSAMCLWFLFPAAPPWYVHQYGCLVDVTTAPNAAGLLRLDDLLGLSYFESYYSRGANVFAAFPSLHNAFPVFGLLTAWRATSWKTRPIHLLYFATMAIASMYFDHHWLIDALAGWLLAGFAVWAAHHLVEPAPHRALALASPIPARSAVRALTSPKLLLQLACLAALVGLVLFGWLKHQRHERPAQHQPAEWSTEPLSRSPRL